ncbi:MAG TPA: hypothetical protein VGW80_11635 [Solirubrobacterales bacterium]|jgi:hypothetical protein|nr:hypothetical protein [Solirubrobacterales bacterium]
MEIVREKWTDERLDDMNARLSEGFDRLDKDMREVGSELAGMNERFEATHRLIIQVGGGLFGTMVIGFLSLLVSH